MQAQASAPSYVKPLGQTGVGIWLMWIIVALWNRPWPSWCTRLNWDQLPPSPTAALYQFCWCTSLHLGEILSRSEWSRNSAALAESSAQMTNRTVPSRLRPSHVVTNDHYLSLLSPIIIDAYTMTLEYQESTSITFEWTLKDLKNLFESTWAHDIQWFCGVANSACCVLSKGESKSKVTKSVRFCGGRWQVDWFDLNHPYFYSNFRIQILFYANSGTEGGYVSLYLSCEVRNICPRCLNQCDRSNELFLAYHRRKRPGAWWKVRMNMTATYLTLMADACGWADGCGMVSSNSALSFEGKYKYISFSAITDILSVNSISKTVLFNVKEANNHSFSFKVCVNTNGIVHAHLCSNY